MPPATHTPPVDRILDTNACENITFPQLLLRTVINRHAGRQEVSRYRTRGESEESIAATDGSFRQNLCGNGTGTGITMGHRILCQTFTLQLMWELKWALYFGIV